MLEVTEKREEKYKCSDRNSPPFPLSCLRAEEIDKSVGIKDR
jgi:hypothetical protein